MIGFGSNNPFPFTFGGGICTKEVMRNDILDKLSFFLSPDDVGNFAETTGEAALIALIWKCNKRISNQGVPTRMLENLAVWEEATNLRPKNSDTMVERRARLAAKMRAEINNAVVDIESVASKALGINYESVIQVDQVDAISYWPGVNPGPPGYEWCSNYAHVAIKMNKLGLTETQFLDKRDYLHRLLHSFLPSWMTFEIGTGDSFVASSGILGQVLV
jgi:hypothetical protein